MIDIIIYTTNKRNHLNKKKKKLLSNKNILFIQKLQFFFFFNLFKMYIRVEICLTKCNTYSPPINISIIEMEKKNYLFIKIMHVEGDTDSY